MTVTKTTGAEVYRVKNAGEWATIVVRSWADTNPDGTEHHRGELLINSTFGSWSNYWNAPGIPFKHFLVGLEFDYLMEKLMGRDTHEHDGLGTYRALQQRLLAMRREGGIDKEAARWLWKEMDDRHESLEGGIESFVKACGDILGEAKYAWSTKFTRHASGELVELLGESWVHAKTRINPGAETFWRDLWSEFARTLENELVNEAEQEYAPVTSPGMRE